MDPRRWEEWIVAYKGWTTEEWKAFYDTWKGKSDFADKNAVLAAEGIRIFSWSGNTTARAVLDIALWLKPNPGPGIGNVHVETAQFVSEYFAIHYGDDATMQLHLHGKSTEQVGHLLSFDSVNVKVAAAYVRLLADFRFGAEGNPSQTSHASLSDWTTVDAVAVWHGYRYGVEGISPGGEGFTVSNSQNRGLDLATTVDLAAGGGKEASMSGSETYFNYYWGR